MLVINFCFLTANTHTSCKYCCTLYFWTSWLIKLFETVRSKVCSKIICVVIYVKFINLIVLQELMGMEDCGNEDEECLKRRVLAEAHLDYIYTQHHKPWNKSYFTLLIYSFFFLFLIVTYIYRKGCNIILLPYDLGVILTIWIVICNIE